MSFWVRTEISPHPRAIRGTVFLSQQFSFNRSLPPFIILTMAKETTD
jgi:hypothetical protein